MEEGFRIWANPSSPHAEGRRAKAALEDARERCKRALGWEGELIFTSGASEALWIALNRAKVDRRIVSAVEHDAVFRAAPDAEVVPVHPLGDGPEGSAGMHGGEVDLDRLPNCTGAVVAVQDINSETGAGQPHHAIWPLVRDQGGLLLVDASQSAGKGLPPVFDCDMMVISAHKFGGPIGIGALLVRDFVMLEPIGGHERGYRQGTENMPAALGMAAALEAWGSDEGHPMARAFDAILSLPEALRASGGQLLRGGMTGSALITAVAHPTLSAQALLIRLDAMGFAVSAGSACSSGTLKKSRVLDAFGVPDDLAARTIRVSMGWNTTPEDLERFAAAWASLA